MDLAEELSGAFYITEFDFGSAYWQIVINPAHRFKTAFRLPDGRIFYWNRAPMGLDISGHALCRFVQNEVLKGCLHKFAASYSDNVYIYTKVDDFSKHMEHVVHVLNRCIDHGMSVKPSKVFIGMRDINVAGVVVSQHGISVNPDKIQGIVDYQFPLNV